MASKADNKLRVFDSVDDLLDNNDNEVILGWVNAYAKATGARKGYQTIYQKKRRLLMKAAAELLDKDELARITQLAAEQAAEREEIDVAPKP